MHPEQSQPRWAAAQCWVPPPRLPRSAGSCLSPLHSPRQGWLPSTRHKGPPGCPSQQGKAAAQQAEHLRAHRHHPSPAPCTFLSSSWDASGTPQAQKPLGCCTKALGAGQGSSTAASCPYTRLSFHCFRPPASPIATSTTANIEFMKAKERAEASGSPKN